MSKLFYSGRGGKKPGAGRPLEGPKKEETIRIRVDPALKKAAQDKFGKNLAPMFRAWLESILKE